MVISAYDEVGMTLNGCREVHAVIGIGGNPGDRANGLHSVGDETQCLDPDSQLLIRGSKMLSDARVGEAAAQLVENGRRKHKLERLVFKETGKELAWWTLWTDEGADEHIGVKHGAQHGAYVRDRLRV